MTGRGERSVPRAASNALRRAVAVAATVSGFGFPVVPQGQARLRCQISAAHEREHLDRAVEAIVSVADKYGVRAA